MAIRVVPTGGPLGADVAGFDMKTVTAAECEAIRKAWHDHLVIRIRDQEFDDDDHVRFMRYFGECGGTPLSVFTGRDHIGSHPEISRISNVRENGKPIGALGAGELVWHTDMSYLDEPPSASMLHAIEIPSHGGDTGFLNMYLAYETLSEAMRRRIATLSIKHEGVHSSSGEIRPGTRVPASGDVRDYPGAVHPIVRTHPDTGRKALFLGRRINAYVIGLKVPESEALLDELWAHACQPRFAWVQRWQLGDLVMWDNRVSMHRRDAFDDNERRLMHRMVVRGERPH